MCLPLYFLVAPVAVFFFVRSATSSKAAGQFLVFCDDELRRLSARAGRRRASDRAGSPTKCTLCRSPARLVVVMPARNRGRG